MSCSDHHDVLLSKSCTETAVEPWRSRRFPPSTDKRIRDGSVFRQGNMYERCLKGIAWPWSEVFELRCEPFYLVSLEPVITVVFAFVG